MKTKMSFEDFIYKNYKSYSHGHDYHHEEVNGLYYKREDYDAACDAYVDYEWRCFMSKLKGGKNEKGNELARG